ncbi:hypothetical protein ABEB36_009557 [Hypothenemus hampei]|uniref:Uncharacterized protein n=1 Tax=Hypothenemus hampei TaxID=57062 RepID=A0ABD1EGT9_HYPHA
MSYRLHKLGQGMERIEEDGQAITVTPELSCPVNGLANTTKSTMQNVHSTTVTSSHACPSVVSSLSARRPPIELIWNWMSQNEVESRFTAAQEVSGTFFGIFPTQTPDNREWT